MESNCFQHVIQSKAQTVVVKLSDTYIMYVAMATAVHMDYTLPLKQVTSFSNDFVNTGCAYWAICAVYAIAYTSNLQKHGTFLKYFS